MQEKINVKLMVLFYQHLLLTIDKNASNLVYITLCIGTAIIFSLCSFR